MFGIHITRGFLLQNTMEIPQMTDTWLLHNYTLIVSILLYIKSTKIIKVMKLHKINFPKHNTFRKLHLLSNKEIYLFNINIKVRNSRRIWKSNLTKPSTRIKRDSPKILKSLKNVNLWESLNSSQNCYVKSKQILALCHKLLPLNIDAGPALQVQNLISIDAARDGSLIQLELWLHNLQPATA